MTTTTKKRLVRIFILSLFILVVFLLDDMCLFMVTHLGRAIVITITWIAYWVTPFMVLGISFAIVTILVKKYKVIYFNIAVVLIALGLLDLMSLHVPDFDIRKTIFQAFNINRKVEAIDMTIEPSKPVTKPDNFEIESEINGFAPRKGVRIKNASFYRDLKLFDVMYTIDSSGLRKSPCSDYHPVESIIFFGCSMTFGYGLDDEQTIPALVATKEKCNYEVYNFAYNGYGTHQMVASLESGRVDSIVKIPPVHIFYIAIPHHIERLSNNILWGQHGPRYELNHDGLAVYTGRFDESPFGKWGEKAYAIFNMIRRSYHNSIKPRSFVLRAMTRQNDDYGLIHDRKKEDLFVALVKRANLLSKQKFPNVKFHFVYWVFNIESEMSMQETRLLDELRESDIDVMLISEMVKEPNNFQQYCIWHPYENHPNFLATNEVSDFIVKNVVR